MKRGSKGALIVLSLILVLVGFSLSSFGVPGLLGELLAVIGVAAILVVALQPGEKASRALFAFSLGPIVSSTLIASAIFFSIAGYDFIILRSQALIPLVLVIAGLALAYYSVRTWGQPVRSVYFYEDLFEIGGKRRATLRYSEIAQLTEVKVKSFFGRRTRIRIAPKGQADPFLVPGNLSNRKLKTGLYAWLLEKTHLPRT